MSRITITKEQTDFIKGIGILLIMFHNYFHWVAPNTGENEFIFDVQNVQNLFSAISNSYLETINFFFSFFGHYGVQLFVFISGYGLSKSYLTKQQSYPLFIKKRVSKIYPPFLIVISMLIVLKAITGSSALNIDWIISLFAKILMLHTFLPNEALSISGPWWFYGMIVQLYLLFIPLFYIIKRWKLKGFLFALALSYCLIFFLYTPLMDRNIFIMANAPGHLPEFALGILLALNPKFSFKVWYIPFLLLLFILGNFYFSFFPFTFIIITYLLVVSILYFLRKELRYTKFIKFYGQISMYLFAFHGLARNPFVEWARASNSPFTTIIIGVFYIITVTIVAFLFKEIYVLTKKWLSKFLKPSYQVLEKG